MADTDYLAASDGTGNAALMHITSPRTALATIIQVDTVSGVPAFFIGTWGTLGADGFITAASARDFFGHVNAGTLVIDKMAPGNVDGGNTSGQVVVIKPSTPAQNLVGNFVKTALNNFGEGELLNGKIVPSVNAGALTVALKTLNGVDPSSTDVVYVRIGNTVRSITAALSVVLAAGTNWFGKGTAPYATVATNYYVYLGYNATDGVTLGVSSYAGGLQYSDFSTTNTNWNYAKISTTTTAAATDVYEQVGRFNAILGVSATFLWTLPAAGSLINVAQPRGADFDGSSLMLNAKSVNNASGISIVNGSQDFGAALRLSFTIAAPCMALVILNMGISSAADYEFQPIIFLDGVQAAIFSPTAASASASGRANVRGFSAVVPIMTAGAHTITGGVFVTAGSSYTLQSNGAAISALILGKVTA